MARLKPVTDDEIHDLVELGFDIAQRVQDYSNRAGQGYCNEISEPLRKISGLMSASRAFADLASTLMIKVQLAEQKNELEKTIRARA